jgi:hypothetical protein
MNRFKQRLLAFSISPYSVPLLLLALTLLSYALMLPWLGFYWDEWPMTWIAHKLGPAGLASYFSTNRPYWGMIYRLTTPILGYVPWHWQLFGLFWRWITAVALWFTLRLVWPRRTDGALFVSALFLVFPGFSQQSIGMMYGHFFVVLSAYLLSLGCSLAAIQEWGKRPVRFYLLTLLALALALVNLLAMEYFFLLELLRPFLIFLSLQNHARIPAAEGPAEARALSFPGTQTILRQAAMHWLPYLGLFLGAGAWRAFFFSFQTQNYNFKMVDQLKADPLKTVMNLLYSMGRDIALVTGGAWAKPFRLPDLKTLGQRTTLYLVAVLCVGLAGSLVYLFKVRTSDFEKRGRQTWALSAILVGLVALLLAGPPFWLTRLIPSLVYPADRFNLPFMLGSSLLVGGLLGLLPGRRAYKIVLLSVLLAFSAGLHFQEAVAFRRDWGWQKSMLWQMSWRMPAIQPGTILLSSDLTMRYVSDNSLTGPLNWIYAPENHTRQMSYMFYFASIRSTAMSLLEKGNSVQQDYLASVFNGSSDQMVGITFHAPACLRVLDPQLDPVNIMLPEIMRQAAEVSDTKWILPEAAGLSKPDLTPEIFGSEPARGWCYYFEKADLARQQGDWQMVVDLGDKGLALENDYPNDPMERMPFLEGYAHVGNWTQARELTRKSMEITPLLQPVLCRLWRRIDENVPITTDKTATVKAVREELSCN